MRRLVRFGLVLGLAVLVAAVTVAALGWLWEATGDSALSVHGWIALSIALIGTGGLAWGLMALAFHSSRSGRDAEADGSLERKRGIDEAP